MDGNKETVFEVEGMSCGSCVRHVEAALGKLDGVSAVEVKLEEGTVRVEHDAAKAPVERVVVALQGEGYVARERGA